MRIRQPTAAEMERRARAAARRHGRDEAVAAGALRRARGSATSAAAALRAQADAYRAEADRLSVNCRGGTYDAWQAAQRRDRAADLLDPGGRS